MLKETRLKISGNVTIPGDEIEITTIRAQGARTSTKSLMLMYASGGRTLRRFLEKGSNVKIMNRIAGALIMGVGVWLAAT